MAFKNKQTALKQKSSHCAAAHGKEFKKSKIKTRQLKKRTSNVDETDDEQDVLEMERNFILLSERSSVLSTQEISGVVAEEEEATEDFDEDIVKHERHHEGCDTSGSDEDSEDIECVSRPAKGHSISERLCTKNDINKELSAMSFEEVMGTQNKLGIKAYKQITYGTLKNNQAREPVKHLSKHRPQEISAKKPAPFLRKVVPVKKTTLRDPRFDDLSGEFKPQVFSQTYKFINEIRQRETEMVKKRLKKVKSNVKREELKYLLQRMENQERSRQRQEKQRQKELQFKRKQRELVGQGHRPFYLKKSDKKKLELAEKFNQLKKSGKLENFLSKKRKRNAIKDRRRMPSQKK